MVVKWPNAEVVCFLSRQSLDRYNFLLNQDTKENSITLLKKSFFLFFHSLREKNPNATAQEIEHILDGNMCRCTGYRSIHDAFKSFATDASDSIRVHSYITQTNFQTFLTPHPPTRPYYISCTHIFRHFCYFWIGRMSNMNLKVFVSFQQFSS